MKTWLGAIIGCFGFFLALQAHGFQLKTTETGARVRWMKAKISYRFHSSMKQIGQAAQKAIHKSFSTWELALSQQIRFQKKGYTPKEPMGYDKDKPQQNENVISWVRSSWSHNPDAMAITLITYRKDTGEILDADIAFNGALYRWYVAGHKPLSQRESLPLIEVANTATHEIGHFLGLSHSKDPGATMYYSQTESEESKRELHDDDHQAIDALYPLSGMGQRLMPHTTPGDAPLPVQVGCSGLSTDAPGPTGWSLALLALLLAWGMRRRPRLLGAATLLLAIGLNASHADATSQVQYSLQRLTQRAKLIVSGTVVAQKSAWQGKHIYTFSTVDVKSCHKGSCQKKQVVVQQLGGSVGNIGMYVQGSTLLKVKSQTLLFLYSAHGQVRLQSKVRSVHHVVGLTQGIFRYFQRNGVSWLQSTAAVKAKAAVKHPGHHHSHGVKHAIKPMPASQLLQTIRACLTSRQSPSVSTEK